MIAFEAANADEVWLKVARAFAQGEGRPQPSRDGMTLELLHAAITILNPKERWVASRNPPMNPAFALAEVIWILNGHNDSEFLNFWNRSLPRFAGPGSSYHGAYGYRLRHAFGIDQLDRACDTLEANVDSRQVVLQIWDPVRDLGRDGLPNDPDIPCNLSSILKVRDGKLEWLQILRSNDLFLGVPYNFIQFTTLQEILSGWIGVKLGTYTQISDSLHVYSRDLDAISSASAIAAPPNVGSLVYPREISELALKNLDERARMMTGRDLSERRLKDAVQTFEGPEEFGNWLVVLGAEAARRRGWKKILPELMARCSNDVLRFMLERWHSRTAEPQSRVVHEPVLGPGQAGSK